MVADTLFCGELESTAETAALKPAPGVLSVTVVPPPFVDITCGAIDAVFGVAPAGATATLYGGVPPVITNPTLVPFTHIGGLAAAGVITSAGGAAGGGITWVPGALISVAVVWRPIASTMVNTSGFTHVPLVTASNAPPEKKTVELTIPTAVGKVDDTLYGGVPP